MSARDRLAALLALVATGALAAGGALVDPALAFLLPGGFLAVLAVLTGMTGEAK
jgi:hypothetical protein